MNEEIKEELRGRLEDYVRSITRKRRGKGNYNCPICGSGTGPNNSAAFHIIPADPTKWKCFSCQEGGDIFDLIGKVEGITEYSEQVRRAAEIFGITYQNPPEIKQYAKDSKPAAVAEEEREAADYKQFFLQAHKDLDKTTYHRGISRKTLDRFCVGYVENWKPPKAPNAPASPRLIIPTSEESYLARDTRPAEQIPEAQRDYTKSKAGRIHFFNIEALQKARGPIFITEGEIDALSIIDAGGEAVALGSTSMTGRFLDLLKEKGIRPAQPLIIATDNDKAGSAAGEKLKTGLQALKIDAEALTLPEGIKDPNEALLSDREALARAVAEAVARARAKQEEAEREQRDAEQAAREEYLHTAAKFYIKDFWDGVKARANTPAIPTGFTCLDDKLDGGLYEGLCFVGGVSSIGKTAFVMQIADQIAQGGRDVLIFSLEMARSELMARSISRHTFQRAQAKDGNANNAKTTRGITAGHLYQYYSQEEIELIRAAALDYDQYAAHLYISEGVGDIGVERIKEDVQKHIRYTGNTPVVIVDYLQILAPYEIRATDKQNTDKAVLELKRISRDYKIPVIAISSFNRTNYKNGAAMEAFKESGAIEYTSDLLIGLQFKGVSDEKFNEEKERENPIREISLKILKNRNGIGRATINYIFHANYNFYEEYTGNLKDVDFY